MQLLETGRILQVAEHLIIGLTIRHLRSTSKSEFYLQRTATIALAIIDASEPKFL